MSLAGKAIAAKVRRARIEDVLGEGGTANVHGETQQKLDVIANDILMTMPRQPADHRGRRIRGRRRADDPQARRRRRQVLRRLRSARRLVEPGRVRRRRHHLFHPQERPDDPRRGRDALSERHVSGGGRLHPLRLVHGLRPDDRTGRRHVRAGSVDRIVRARVASGVRIPRAARPIR